jgi:hypothetical protein
MVDALINSTDIGSVVVNSTDVLESIVPLLLERFSWVFTLIKAIGILFLIYMVYLAYSLISSQKQKRRVKRIEEVVMKVDEKVDHLLKDISVIKSTKLQKEEGSQKKHISRKKKKERTEKFIKKTK